MTDNLITKSWRDIEDIQDDVCLFVIEHQYTWLMGIWNTVEDVEKRPMTIGDVLDYYDEFFHPIYVSFNGNNIINVYASQE